jgi:hypothetical protein
MRMIFAIAVVAAAAGATAHATANTTFVSKMYGYSIVLPGEWVSRPASIPWTGGPPYSDSPEVDFYYRVADGRDVRVSALSVPRSTTLRKWTNLFVTTKLRAAAGCVPLGAVRATTLAGSRALTFGGRCSSGAHDYVAAATVRRGRVYLLALLSPSSYSAPSDRRVFETVRRSFRFVR